MTGRRLLVPAVVAAGVALASLDASVAGSHQRSAFRAELTDRETRVVQVPDGGLLALSNMVGDVTVRRSAGSDVRIDVVRIARGRTDADARRGLADVTARVSTRGSRVLVEAAHGAVRDAPYAVTVSYDVTAPAATDVVITSLTGNIHVSGLTGEVSAVTTTGDVEVRDASRLSKARTTTGQVTLSNVQNDGPLEAGAISGTVAATGVRAPRLRLDTITGAVTARDITATRVEITTTQGSLRYEGRIARDGRYDLRTHSGAITFVPEGATGFELRAQTYAGRADAAAALGLRVTSRSRRELHGVVGDGSALVLLTTFSGSIVVGGR